MFFGPPTGTPEKTRQMIDEETLDTRRNYVHL
jgi:hypothetical protein